MTSSATSYWIIDMNDAWAADPILDRDRQIASLIQCERCRAISTTWNKPVCLELQDVPVDPVTFTYETGVGAMAMWVWEHIHEWIDPAAIHAGEVFVTEPPKPREQRLDFVSFVRHYPLTIPQHGVDARYSQCDLCGHIRTITTERFGYFLRKDIAQRDVVISHDSEIIVSDRVATALETSKARVKRLKRLRLKPIQVTESLLPNDTWEVQLPHVRW